MECGEAPTATTTVRPRRTSAWERLNLPRCLVPRFLDWASILSLLLSPRNAPFSFWNVTAADWSLLPRRWASDNEFAAFVVTLKRRPLHATGQLLATSPARRGCYWSASSDIVKRSVASQLKLNSTYRSGALNELVQPSLLLHKLHVLMIDPSKVCCKSGIPSHRRFCFNVFPQLVAVSPLIFVYIFLFAPGEKSFRLLLHIYRTFIASQR